MMTLPTAVHQEPEHCLGQKHNHHDWPLGGGVMLNKIHHVTSHKLTMYPLKRLNLAVLGGLGFKYLPESAPPAMGEYASRLTS